MAKDRRMNLCWKCRWWDDLDHKDLGGCHRYPPRVARLHVEAEDGMPVVGGNNWCGEWEQEPEKPAPKKPDAPKAPF